VRPRRVDDKPVLEERPVDAIMALPRASAMTLENRHCHGRASQGGGKAMFR